MSAPSVRPTLRLTRAGRRRVLAASACSLLALVATGSASAAQFCATSPTALAAALNVAKANGQDDDIRVVAGTHVLTNNLGVITNEANALTVSGGWNAACTLKNGGITVLDGNSIYWILYIHATGPAPIAVTDLDFQFGTISNGSNSGAGLNVQSQGDVRVERNRFVGNGSNHDTGGLFAASSANLIVRNNLLFGNRAPYFGAAQFIANGAEAIVTGNTIVANTATQPSAIGGIRIGGGAHYTLGNNLIYFNSNVDLSIQTNAPTLLHNDIGPIVGWQPGPDSAGNLDTDPLFAPGLFNLHLAANSPLVNAGYDEPPGGLGTHDADGAPRRQGARVDIGAYETDVLMRGGFEAPPLSWP